MSNYLVLSHLSVRDANAVSSPISIGTPAVTAFMGATHRLERYLNANGYGGVKITGTGIVIHSAELRTYSSGSRETTIMTGRPLTKSGGRPSTIPDPKVNLTVSLICEIEDVDYEIYDEKEFLLKVDQALSTELRIAGGDILAPRVKGGKTVSSFLDAGRIKYFPGKDAGSPADIKDIKRLLTPGYALIERRDLLQKEMETGADPIDALIDYLAIHHNSEESEDGKVEWTMSRKVPGWIVPIAVGYQGISKPGQAVNQRDDSWPHIFGENLITLGEYRIINAVKDLDRIIWRYDVDLDRQKFLSISRGEN